MWVWLKLKLTSEGDHTKTDELGMQTKFVEKWRNVGFFLNVRYLFGHFQDIF